MPKKYKRPLMMFLALVFLLESWLWDATGALVTRLVRALPFEKYRALLVSEIERLSPLQTLSVFIIPVLVLLPIKFFALWLLAKGYIFSGILSILGAKLAGLGVTSFLFALCKPKILQLRAVAWLYHQCLYWRARAHAMVKPYTRYVRRYLALLKPRSPHGKLLAKWRARMHKARRSL